jgi:hypothetical protein
MMTGKIIEDVLKEAWEEFIKYFDKNNDKYSREYFDHLLKELDEKKAKKEVEESHWVCWNESDLMMQLCRYFYSQREIKSALDNEFLDIEMHLDKNLNYSNFQGYLFDDKLGKKGKLYKELGRFPKLDLIITGERSFAPFLLCAEAKHFHSSVMYGTVDEAIEKDIKTLSVIEKLGITDAIAYIILDDYYCHHKNDIKKIAHDYSEKYNLDDKLKIYYHGSRKKAQ